MEKRKIAHVIVDSTNGKDLDDLLELLKDFAWDKDILTPIEIENIKRAKREIAKGNYYTFDEVFGNDNGDTD
ncbi:hypothetical protein [Halobacillus sp. H74]|uniref:hypothetical protein n=1 Tax=Halobacillus sp. H74 TaxID=3457436 RepID=UPI003FCD15A0